MTRRGTKSRRLRARWCRRRGRLLGQAAVSSRRSWARRVASARDGQSRASRQPGHPGGHAVHIRHYRYGQKIVDFISDAGYAAAILTAQGRASVIRAASALISLGMVMFDMFVSAAGNISTKASLSAKRLGEGLQAMGQALPRLLIASPR